MIIWGFTLVLYLALLIIDLPTIYHSKSKKLMCIYGVLMISAFAITGLSHLGIPVPSPANLIKNIVDHIIGA